MADEILDIDVQIDNEPWRSADLVEWVGSGQNRFRVRLDGLENNQSYNVRVRGVNAAGHSHPSNRLIGTPAAIEVGTPVIASSVGGNESAQIFWQYIPGKAVIHNTYWVGTTAIIYVGVESTGNLPITEYEYFIQTVGAQWQGVPVQNGEMHIPDLNPNLVYRLKVRASNVMGAGLESEEILLRQDSEQLGISGGDEVYEITQGGVSYRVHEFLNSTSLVVNGQGEYEYQLTGGGGGGGVLERTSTLNAGTYSVVIGEGGNGSNDPETDAQKGGDTSFAGHTAIGGGYGGTNLRGGGDGGNGGGGGQNADGGNGVLGQGADGEDSWNFYGKRGGGSENPNSRTFRQAGRMSSITGVDVEYGRGGSTDTANGGAKPSGTGAGGDGSSGWSAGGGQKGGKGSFIIRYRI